MDQFVMICMYTCSSMYIYGVFWFKWFKILVCLYSHSIHLSFLKFLSFCMLSNTFKCIRCGSNELMRTIATEYCLAIRIVE